MIPLRWRRPRTAWGVRALPPLLILCACRVDPCPPEPAEGLRWIQLPLGGAIGEAALLLGPEGGSVLIDVGNDSHADAVLDAGQAWTGERAVDAVIITHFHADHVGAASALAGELAVRDAIITRGFVHLEDANEDELEGLRSWIDAGAEHRPLCDGGGCPGLEEPLDLGGGAQLRWLAADAQDGGGPLLEGELEENARSLVGLVAWGDFELLFGGDLTGGGKDTPDVESALAPAVPAVEVMQANHHGIRSSSNTAWLDAALPADGADRQVLVGAGPGYAAAPHGDLLEAWAPRLGDGFVWAPDTGALAGRHERLRSARGAVEVRVSGDGAYAVLAADGDRCEQSGFRSR